VVLARISPRNETEVPEETRVRCGFGISRLHEANALGEKEARAQGGQKKGFRAGRGTIPERLTEGVT